MRKFIIILHIYLMNFLVRVQNAVAKRKLKEGDFEDYSFLRENLNTPKKIADWLMKEITYKDDGALDYPQEPVITFVRRTGDCEDFSYLAADCLSYHGIENDIIGLYWGKGKEYTGHSICCYKDGDGWQYIDTAGLNIIYKVLKDVEELVNFCFGNKPNLIFSIRDSNYKLKQIKIV